MTKETDAYGNPLKVSTPLQILDFIHSNFSDSEIYGILVALLLVHHPYDWGAVLSDIYFDEE